MLDKIKDIGDFVEFELLCYGNEKDIKYLQGELNEFVKKFEPLNFDKANLPYRDFVAYKTYTNILPQSKLRAILFDLDGTLINSEQKFFESFKYVILSKYNYNITYEEYENNELRRNANLINELKSRGIINNNELVDNIMCLVYTEYEKRFLELLEEKEVAFNFELLKQLKNKGLRLALVSTSKRKFIDILLSKLNIKDLFEVVICREDANNLKPDPEAYNKALSLLNISCDNCIAIEDSERGIKASREANIKTIQVNDYINDKTKGTDKLCRILLPIINFIDDKG